MALLYSYTFTLYAKRGDHKILNNMQNANVIALASHNLYFAMYLSNSANCAVDITDNFVPPPGIPMNYCAMHRGTGNHAV